MRDISVKVHSDQEADHAEQDRRHGDKRHHEEELYDFVAIEPAVEAAVHVPSIVISLWRSQVRERWGAPIEHEPLGCGYVTVHRHLT